MRTRIVPVIGLGVCLLSGVDSLAAPPLNRAAAVSQALDLLSNTSVDGMAGAFRGYLAHNLPPVLYEASPNWGHQKLVPEGPAWLEKQPAYVLKNDGLWKKITFTADNLADTLVFDIRNLNRPEPGKMTFDVFLSFDARVDYEQQKWRSGIRVFATNAKARMRVKVALQCEVTARLERGELLPDTVVRLHVSEAKVSYDNFVTEHVAGVGGELARLLGDGVRGGLHRWDPGLEPELLAKAGAAIVKAGDTKEVRLTLTNLFGKKK